jgi:hypothetical protein
MTGSKAWGCSKAVSLWPGLWKTRLAARWNRLRSSAKVTDLLAFAAKYSF